MVDVDWLVLCQFECFRKSFLKARCVCLRKELGGEKFGSVEFCCDIACRSKTYRKVHFYEP